MQQTFSSTAMSAFPQRDNQPYASVVGSMPGGLPEDGVAPPSQHFEPSPSFHSHSHALALPDACPPDTVYQFPQNPQHPHYPHSISYANPGLYSYHDQFQHARAHAQSPSGQIGAFGTFALQPWQLSIQQPFSPYYYQPQPQYHYRHGSWGQTGSLGEYSFPVGQVAKGSQPFSATRRPVMTQLQLRKNFNQPTTIRGVHQAPRLPSSPPEQLASQTMVPRGPPRKPKLSGHALWVGNLPPKALIGDLKDHFSIDATKEIESLFLISKSNCAFVNYITEAACTSARERFNHSVFQGAKLVCRPQRSSTAAQSTPASAAASGVFPHPFPQQLPDSDAPNIVNRNEAQSDEIPKGEESINASKTPERFFIIKSLAVEDLEQCVCHNVWLTQTHNEELLNSAYESAVDVYLIFSANKSGEYFGYARMASSIPNSDISESSVSESSIPESAQTTASMADLPEEPTYISTPATEFAPEGRITSDSARGTIFWESTLSNNKEEQDGGAFGGDENEIDSQRRGKAFKVEWKSTRRVPFSRTRGMRNFWNANREIKVARDGTELETGVGKRLVQLFHEFRPPPSSFVGT